MSKVSMNPLTSVEKQEKEEDYLFFGEAIRNILISRKYLDQRRKTRQDLEKKLHSSLYNVLSPFLTEPMYRVILRISDFPSSDPTSLNTGH